MRLRTRTARTAALLVAALAWTGLVLAGPASAHATFHSGDLTFEEFGLTNEPVKVGEETAFEFTVTKDGKPVTWTDAQLKQLTVHVFVGTVKPSPELAGRQPGGKPLQLALRATPWVAPGAYVSDAFAFSDPGRYTAHLHSPLAGVAGAAKTVPVGGQVIDLVAPMGPTTYGGEGVEPLTTWPRRLPTTGELATRQQADVKMMGPMMTSLAVAQDTAAAAKSDLAWTRAAAGLGIGLALISILIATVAVRRRQPATAGLEDDSKHWLHDQAGRR